MDDKMSRTLFDADYVALDNSSPPQMWAWRGEPGDESSEPWVRINLTLTDMLLRDWKRLRAENEQLRAEVDGLEQKLANSERDERVLNNVLCRIGELVANRYCEN